MYNGSMAASFPLFDPQRVRGPAEPVVRGTLTVSQLTNLIKGVLTQHLPGTLHVVGELSNVTRPSSGHLYFTLKDEGSEIRGVMWRSDALKIKFEPQDGLEVIATGNVDVYEPRGQYQLYVRKLEPRGVGALELAFRQLREKLQREGLFDPARKKPLPKWPRRIAVVTSATGAAIRDMLKVLRRRFPCVDIFVYPVRVQGEGAAAEIAAAIGTLNRHSAKLGGIDVMIVGRGGGSLEDLWAFNEEVVARAISASEIPIVSAVGHEVDVTISDLVADVRAPTPSAAAEIVVPVLDEVLGMLAEHGRALHRHARHAIDVSASRLEALARHEWFRDPIGRLARRAQQMDEVVGRLNLAITRRMAAINRELHRCEVVLSSIRPEAYLQKQQRRLLDASYRLRAAMEHASRRSERRLSVALARFQAASPRRAIERNAATIEQLHRRLTHDIQHRLALVRQGTDGLAARLDAVSHKSVLSRGFSITRHAKKGTIIRAADQVKAGDRIATETAAGTFESRVLEQGQGELFEQ
jgi:exodeoxyribonuclease VII large subunit